MALRSVWGAIESATERGTRYSAVQVYRICKRLTLNVASHTNAEKKQKKKNIPKERRSFGHRRERERAQWVHFEAVLPSVTEN